MVLQDNFDKLFLVQVWLVLKLNVAPLNTGWWEGLGMRSALSSKTGGGESFKLGRDRGSLVPRPHVREKSALFSPTRGLGTRLGPRLPHSHLEEILGMRLSVCLAPRFLASFPGLLPPNTVEGLAKLVHRMTSGGRLEVWHFR